jgi:hypothetical protein
LPRSGGDEQVRVIFNVTKEGSKGIVKRHRHQRRDRQRVDSGNEARCDSSRDSPGALAIFCGPIASPKLNVLCM